MNMIIIFMKFAIIGAGVAGAFLGNILNRDHNVEIFEMSNKDNHFPVCAWGASKNMLEYYSKLAGLNFEDYILHKGKKISIYLPNGEVEQLRSLGLVTYDKERWEKDLLNGVKVNYNTRCLSDFPVNKYDYVLDCTGFARSMLPKVKDELIVPAYEYMIEYTKPYENEEFYIKGYKGARGYFWYFPLSNNRAFVGAGDINRRYSGLKEFFDEHKDVRILKKIGRPIRLTPPTRMEPLYQKNVIGVGESIGCVFPLLGEGIIPSLICCKILLDSIDNSMIDLEYYRANVLKYFRYYDDVYKLIKLLIEERFHNLRHWRILYNIYKNMKREESRFGFEIDKWKLGRMINALR